MSIKSEVESANAAYAADFGDKASLALPPARGFLIPPAWTRASTRRNSPVSPKATLTWCATLVAGPPTTRSAAW